MVNENLIAFIFDLNSLKNEMLFEALTDKEGFTLINNKSLDEHYNFYNNNLYFYYNTINQTTRIIKKNYSELARIIL